MNMENYRKSSYYTYDIKYHPVWITKYRKLVITRKIALRTRELIRMVCQSNEAEILTTMLGSTIYTCWYQRHPICQPASWYSI